MAILHEFAHAFAAKKLGYVLKKIFLMPYGAGLSLSQEFLDEKDEIIISLAGPLFNFALAFFCIALWWIFPQFYAISQLFVFANLVTGLVNFLPCWPLDGGRILTALLTQKKHSRTLALKKTLICNYVFSAIFLIVFLFNIFENTTFLIFAIFVFVGVFDLKLAGNYTLKNFPLFHNILPNNQQIEIHQFAVSENTEIFKIARCFKKNKLNLVHIIFDNGKIKILTENTIINFFNNCSATEKIGNLIKKY